MLPQSLRQLLREQIEYVKTVWERDCRRGGGIVPLPPSVAHKCPSAERLLAWQFVFPSATMRYSSHTRTGVRYLRFGDNYKIAGRNGALTAELDRLLGPAPAPVHAAA